jgi:hypothetical protein
MMSLEQIRSASDTMTRRAARNGIVPKVFTEENTTDEIRGIPALGHRVPRGWKLVNTYFVDSSGFGSPGEPAMTRDEFVSLVEGAPGFGWAIIEAGQFQVYVGQYEKKGK